jgi:peptidoglycan/LPS O-acetylase OafA/YrhL
VPFWIRRFWRLAPSAWLWLGVNLFLALAFGNSASTMFLPNLRDSLAAVLQVANFHVYECVNQINATQCGSAFIYWSLSLEEQFYLVFPFLMLFLSRRMLIASLTAIALAQIFLPRSFAGLLWLIRTDAISLGALIALAQESTSYRLLTPSFLSTALQRWLAFVVLCILLATIDAPKIHFVEFTTGLIAIVSAVFVWLASFNEGYGIAAGNVRSALTYIGSRSYALYLCHQPIAWLVVHTLRGLPAGLPGFIALVAIFLAAEISYRYVETPLRRRGREIAELIRMRLETAHAPVLAPAPD